MVAADGKRYLTDCLPQSDMLQLVEATPSHHAMTFAKWLITGENQLDSKSRDKAYQLWDSSLLQTIEVGTEQHKDCSRYMPICLVVCMILQDRYAKRTSPKVDSKKSSTFAPTTHPY